MSGGKESFSQSPKGAHGGLAVALAEPFLCVDTVLASPYS